MLELMVIRMHAEFIMKNRHRDKTLRKDERNEIVTAVLGYTREMYPKEAASLSLVWSQCRSKEDFYQGLVTAAERLLLECSGFGINWLTGLVEAALATWDRYLAMECYKKAKFLRYYTLPGIEWCRIIWGQRTATGEFASGGATVAAAAAQDRKRKRPTLVAAVSTGVSDTVVDQVGEEVDDDSDGEVAGKSGANTRRAEAKPVLTPRQKNMSSADKLGNKMVEAFTIASEAKLAPARLLT